MADGVEKWRLELDTKTAEGAIKSFEKRMSEMTNTTALKIAAFNKATDLAVQGLHALGQWMAQGWKDAQQYQRTTQQLSSTLKQLGDANLTWLPTLQKTASEMQRLTGQSDEVGRGLINMALNMGVSSDRIEDLMKAAVRLSNTGLMSMESAVRNLIKSTSGLQGELGEAVPFIRQLSQEQLRAGEAIDIVNEKLSEQLEALTGGGAGAGMRLTSAWNDFGEALARSAATSETLQVGLSGVASELETLTAILDKRGLLGGLAKLAEYSTRLSAGAATLGLSELAFRDEAGGLSGKIDEALIGGGGGASAPQSAVGGSPLMVGGLKIDVSGRAKRRKQRRSSVATYRGAGGGAQTDLTNDALASSFNARLELAQMHNERRVEVEQQLHEQLNEIHETNLQRRIELTNDAAAQQVEAVKKQADEQARWMNKGFSMGMQALNAFVEGGLIGFLKYATGALQGIGMEMVGRGIADNAKATAYAADPFTAAFAPAMFAAAEQELAVGAALTAGGFAGSMGIQAASGEFKDWNLMTGKGGGGGGGMGKGGGMGGGNLPTQAQSDVARVGSVLGGGSSGAAPQKNITIVLEGPVYDGAAAGIAITEAIKTAERAGFKR